MDMSATRIAFGLAAILSGTTICACLYARKLFQAPVVPRQVYPSDFALPKRSHFTKLLGTPTNVAYLVTGASGFIAHYIVEQLLERGETTVYALDIRQPTIALPKGAQFLHCDLTHLDSLKKTLQGKNIQVIYHVAAIIRFMDEFPEQLPLSYNINVTATENVIQACLDLNIPFLVQTSTSHVSVGYDLDPIFYGNERLPYTEKPVNNYAQTKVLAEKAILAANGKKLQNGKTLHTASIRPASIIYGFGDKWGLDTYFVTRDLQLHHHNIVDDFCYVENVALAHLLLEKGLRENPGVVGGHPFLISHDDPLSRENFFTILETLKPNYFTRSYIPYPILYILSRIATFTTRYTTISLGDLDMYTACSDVLQSQQHCFSSLKARKVLGYEPFYTVEQGVKLAWDRWEAAGNGL
ncbi:hypothetical protein SeMB42_g03881 [Synchytrium endobioticum]|uniref:3-beta hydroxysteroid dehydrogenase/isomerase domain-containing protein n=1 Tax=Synchytrium endobioticum TaxID=286115 RepID=A0A507D9D8_9FUNG|nr:hypothetical protein SeMB42_g03881 [Synchytrium endobioticum]TPX47985.1 hypothetical protein SeLEV6574_g02318 [Synchytrium endobioticum]